MKQISAHKRAGMALTLAAIAVARCVQGDTIVSNLGSRGDLPQNTGLANITTGAQTAIAQNFEVGSGVSYELTSAGAMLYYDGSGPNTVTATLWSSRPGQPSDPNPGLPAPDAPIATLGSQTISGSAPMWVFEPFLNVGGLTLEPDKGYWLVLTTDANAPNSIFWGEVNRHTSIDYQENGTGALYWTSLRGANGSWSTVSPPSQANLMALEGNLVALPEPNSVALALLGLAIVVIRGRPRD